MAENGETRSSGRLGRCETMQDFQEVRDLLDERERILDLWHQLENRIPSGSSVRLAAEDRTGPVGLTTTIYLRVPRHVINVMKKECEDRRDYITGILVRNYGIKDA
jgi:hypothetical protein